MPAGDGCRSLYRECAKLTAAYGGRAISDPLEAIADPTIDAVVIGTPTDTHVSLDAGGSPGKSVLCEKPVDLDIQKRVAQRVLGERASRVMLGLIRRFDLV